MDNSPNALADEVDLLLWNYSGNEGDHASEWLDEFVGTMKKVSAALSAAPERAEAANG